MCGASQAGVTVRPTHWWICAQALINPWLFDDIRNEKSWLPTAAERLEVYYSLVAGYRDTFELCINQIVAARPQPLNHDLHAIDATQLNGLAVWVSRRSIQAEPPRCRTGLEMMSAAGRRRGTSCPSTSTFFTDGVL